jgi:hypothetical protein
VKNRKLYSISSTTFSDDNAAFIMTNENLRCAMKNMPSKTDRALTVAASGDHPLWCSLYGAKHVDTFDITFSAKCIMDIKVAALSCLNRDEYRALLEDLYAQEMGWNVFFQEKMLKKLPIDDLKHIFKNRKRGLFIKGAIDEYRLPTVEEYEKLQKIVKKTYRFFHTDIKFLGYELKESYDFIHLSNIFEHMKIIRDQQQTIIMSLMEHVNVGGRILFQNLIFAPWEKPPVPEHLCSSHGDTDWRFIQKPCDMLTILERVR